MQTIERRTFLKAAAIAGGAVLTGGRVSLGQAQSQKPRLLKAVQYNMLPRDLKDKEKFALARKCGFEGIEVEFDDGLDEKAAAELGKLAAGEGTPIHSIVFGGWGTPLSDPRAEVADKGIAGMQKCLRNAKAMGAGSVLLVPAIVTETVSYADAYKRSQENVRKLIPTAKETGVVIAVEIVWNKFLLSPLEFARYVDEFQSPFVRAYFDTGNIILFGFAQDWIRTLGKRTVRIHLKDFKRQGNQWVNLLDGDVNWKEVRKALAEVGYEGYLTPELSGGDEAYLKDLSKRIDKIVAGV